VAALTGVAGLALQNTAGAQGALEEIVVTATRRAQDLQEVPVSIVAITGDNLELQGLDSLEDVGNNIPNINIQGGGGGTDTPQFRVRGLPGVGIYIDGVWQIGTAGFLTQDFVDLDRIEVLRGPQGTTYGRDSVGGAIRMWTKQPGDEFGANIAVTAGTLDRRDVKMSVDVPITDNLLTKWTGASLYRDGYIQGLTLDQKFGQIDQTVFRGDMLWTPADNVSFRLTYSQDTNSMTEPRAQDGIFDTAAQQGQGILVSEFYALAGAEPFDPMNTQAGFPGGAVGKWENKSGTTLPTGIEHEQTALDINWDFTDSLSIQFLTAVTKQDRDNLGEWDNSAYTLVEDLNRDRTDLFSEEIQLAFAGDRLNWVVGAYYWDQEIIERDARFTIDEFRTLEGDPAPQLSFDTVYNSQPCLDLVNDAINPIVNTTTGARALNTCQQVGTSALNGAYDRLTENKQDGYALFAEGTYSLTDTLDLTLGLRYHDQTNTSGAMAFIPGVTAPKPRTTNLLHTGGDPFAGMEPTAVSEVQFDETTYKLALQNQFSDSMMGYVSYSEGFDSGGISTVTTGAIQTRYPYEPQIIENYEVGIRTDLADGRLRLNATLFHSNWTNIQNAGVVFDANGNQIPQLVTTNVGDAEAEGLELELTVLPTDSLMFTFNVGLLDTAYTDIAPGTFALDTSTEFAQAPDLTYNIGIQHTADLGNGGSFTSRLDYSYTDQFWRSLPFLRMSWYDAVPSNYDESGDIGIVNARFTYQPVNDDWTLSVFGTNLTNEYMLNSGFFHGIWGFDFSTVARPREAGVSLNFRF
jgi:iron complex outermembrane receptor protein